MSHQTLPKGVGSLSFLTPGTWLAFGLKHKRQDWAHPIHESGGERRVRAGVWSMLLADAGASSTECSRAPLGHFPWSWVKTPSDSSHLAPCLALGTEVIPRGGTAMSELLRSRASLLVPVCRSGLSLQHGNPRNPERGPQVLTMCPGLQIQNHGVSPHSSTPASILPHYRVPAAFQGLRCPFCKKQELDPVLSECPCCLGIPPEELPNSWIERCCLGQGARPGPALVHSKELTKVSNRAQD